MKGKGRNIVGKQQDSCDVWLDPLALKRRKNVATKSALTLLGRDSRPAAIIGLPHPCTKQTTISTFFTAQKAGEKPTDPNQQFMTSSSNNVVNLKDTELVKGKRTRVSVLQPSSLPDCQRQPAKATKVSGLFLCNTLSSRAQSHTGTLPVAQEEDTITEGREAFLTTDLIRHLEGKGRLQQQVAPVSPLKERNDGWRREESPAFFSQRSPSFKIIPNQRVDAGKQRRLPSSLVDATSVEDSDSENIDPELEENLSEEAYLDFNQTGFCRTYTDATSYENSSLASTQRLFTQDSEGCRVILHHFGGEGSKSSLPKELWWSKRPPVRSAFNNKSCFGDGWARDRSPPGSLGRRLSPLTERPCEKSCYDLLFTEDSEGNKVIKH